MPYAGSRRCLPVLTIAPRSVQSPIAAIPRSIDRGREAIRRPHPKPGETHLPLAATQKEKPRRGKRGFSTSVLTAWGSGGLGAAVKLALCPLVAALPRQVQSREHFFWCHSRGPGRRLKGQNLQVFGSTVVFGLTPSPGNFYIAAPGRLARDTLY